MFAALRKGYPHYQSQYNKPPARFQFPDEDDHPHLLVAVARYPVMILAIIGLAYLLFTPVPHSDEQHAITHYSCTMNPNQDWCRELREDRAHGRKEVSLKQAISVLLQKEQPSIFDQPTHQLCKESHNDPVSQKHR